MTTDSTVPPHVPHTLAPEGRTMIAGLGHRHTPTLMWNTIPHVGSGCQVQSLDYWIYPIRWIGYGLLDAALRRPQRRSRCRRQSRTSVPTATPERSSTALERCSVPNGGDKTDPNGNRRGFRVNSWCNFPDRHLKRLERHVGWGGFDCRLPRHKCLGVGKRLGVNAPFGPVGGVG